MIVESGALCGWNQTRRSDDSVGRHVDVGDDVAALVAGAPHGQPEQATHDAAGTVGRNHPIRLQRLGPLDGLDGQRDTVVADIDPSSTQAPEDLDVSRLLRHVDQ